MDNVNLFTCTSVQHHFPVRWCSRRLIVTWAVLPVAHVLLTLPEHIIVLPGFSGVSGAHSFVFCVVFCRSFSVLLSFFFWPLYWLSIFNVSFPIIPLVSDLASHFINHWKWSETSLPYPSDMECEFRNKYTTIIIMLLWYFLIDDLIWMYPA